MFHFTSSIETLKSILLNDFMALYSAENSLNVVSAFNNPDLEKGIPMVCFCDIPLSKVSKHNEMYGNYAIGLSKEWAIKNKINPVIYTYTNSALTDNTFELFYKIFNKEDKDLLECFNSIFQYIKPYSGPFKKGGKVFENVKFYDEREWRYVPKLFEDISSWLRKTDEKSLEESIINVNEVMLETFYEKAKLKFDANDIKYLIVKNADDIHEIIKFFKNLKSNKYSMTEIELLMTKISSLEDIIHDY